MLTAKKKKYLLVGFLTLAIGVFWTISSINGAREGRGLTLEADRQYFGEQLPTIKIGDQVCEYSGIDKNSGKNMYLCEDGQYYVHKDWH